MKKNDTPQSDLRALYIRVSTEAQAAEGYSIDAQTERLIAYCTAMGWSHYETYVDGGFSGSNLQRPQIQKLIKDAESGKVKSVIVFKLDRLSRSQKDTLYLIEDVFMPNQVDFISLNESIDTSTPYGRAMIGILSAFAQLERENIFLRTRMGMLERVKQGYWPGGGGVPFGYNYDRNLGILIPNEDAQTVRKIYQLYIKGYSAQKLADMFNLKSDKTVTDMLTRRSNLGYVSYNGVDYPGRHEAIVSEELFELAMKKMQERSAARVTPKSAHLLTGLIYCGCCGARLRYIKWGKNGYKLICYSHEPSKPYMHRDKDCPYHPVWADQVEDIVIKDLFRLSADFEVADSAAVPAFDPLEDLQKQITQTEYKLRRLYQLYANDTNDVLLSAIEDTKRSLAMLREEYRSEEKTHTSTKQVNFVRSQVACIADTWDYLSDTEKQAVLRDCISKIVITDDRIEIFYTFRKKSEKAKVA